MFLGHFKMASMQNTDSNVNGNRWKSLSQSISRGAQPCTLNVFAIRFLILQNGGGGGYRPILI